MSIPLISKIKPKNGGSFPLVDAQDVEMPDGRRLSEFEGLDGEDGATFMPSVDEDGNLSWTNDKGLDNPAPVNITGPQGPQGIPGSDGHTPVKGEDYFTDADKEELVAAVLAGFVDVSEVGM